MAVTAELKQNVEVNGKAEASRRIDPSKLKINRNPKRSELPADMKFVWGTTFTDHMLNIDYHPESGWGDPEIVPYGPLAIDPCSSCLQYSTTAFEGMKAYRAHPGAPVVLFRPEMNMARLRRSAARLELPDFDPEAFVELIKTLIKLDEHLVPPSPNALYIRPTIIGTRPSLGVGPSKFAKLFVFLSPVGPFFPTKTPSPTNGHINGHGADIPARPKATFTPVSLLATVSAARSWPGGVGSFKLAGNYSPCFQPQMMALERGYQQNLWCLNGNLTECGQMNLFVVFGNKVGEDEYEVEVTTPALDGTILPGITRDSVLALLRNHAKTSQKLPEIPDSYKLTITERVIPLEELVERSAKNEVLEVFGTGTAAVILPIERIGLEDGRPDMSFPEHEGGLGYVARGVFEMLSSIQEGRIPEHPWTVRC